MVGMQAAVLRLAMAMNMDSRWLRSTSDQERRVTRRSAARDATTSKVEPRARAATNLVIARKGSSPVRAIWLATMAKSTAGSSRLNHCVSVRHAS